MMKANLMPAYVCRLVCLFLLAGALANCAYFNADEPDPADMITYQRFDFSGGPAARLAEDLDLIELNNSLGDDSVEMFSLNSPSPSDMNARSEVLQRGEPYDYSPGVTIFPLDGVEQQEMPQSPATNIYPEPLVPSPAVPAESVDVEDLSAVSPALHSQSTTAVMADYVGKDPVSSVFFAHNSTSLNSPDKRRLADLAADLTLAPGEEIHVVGHASRRANIDDPDFRQLVNLKVSAHRAYTVASYLVEKGLPARSLVITGRGEQRVPEDLGADIDTEAAARRVDIFTIR